jgi:two-component system, NarL family, sensor histidine kinase LiaS
MLRLMNIFRKLRWQLTLSYTLVTVCTLLVITMILGGILLPRIFVSEVDINAEQMIQQFMKKSYGYFLISQMVSQSPVDTKALNLYLKEAQSTVSMSNFLSIGAIRLWVSTNASVRVWVVAKDGTLLGTSFDVAISHYTMGVGFPFDTSQIPGSEALFQAALSGVTEPKRLYSILEQNKRIVFVGPLFDQSGEDPDRVVGVVVIELNFIPSEKDIPVYILMLAGRSMVIFLLATGIMGSLFGAFFAHGLSARFKRISAITDQWSAGDFSRYIGDATGDEIAQFTRRLDNMAEQLQSLLRRRQDMAVSEERNRLARDLHDSAKQQALAASFELGTALMLFDRDPQASKKHLVEADALVDTVRKELTNLVDELRPQPIEGLLTGQDFSETLKAHALEWSQRSGIEMDICIEGDTEIPVETRETLFRIAQEALANIARHSSAMHADLSLEFGPEAVTLTIRDDGQGFDPHVPHDGVGLASMRERAEASGGSFALESAPGQGVQIIVTLPVEV